MTFTELSRKLHFLKMSFNESCDFMLESYFFLKYGITEQINPPLLKLVDSDCIVSKYI